MLHLLGSAAKLATVSILLQSLFGGNLHGYVSIILFGVLVFSQSIVKNTLGVKTASAQAAPPN